MTTFVDALAAFEALGLGLGIARFRADARVAEASTRWLRLTLLTNVAIQLNRARMDGHRRRSAFVLGRQRDRELSVAFEEGVQRAFDPRFGELGRHFQIEPVRRW